MQNRFRLRALALAVSSALILTACGGGGSSATTLGSVSNFVFEASFE
ncbi:MAG: hypothetical protein PHW25_21060 [Zoogloea sp.]|nr:hypothetical protein [Zoogloea sp.]MDD3329576.1 hypothetical protein [Zoogloea sp.]